MDLSQSHTAVSTPSASVDDVALAIYEASTNRQDECSSATSRTSFSPQPSSPLTGSSAIGGGISSRIFADDTPNQVITVVCGSLTGLLHYELYKCPGIHQECIEYDGQFVSPKTLTVMAAKDKQKDWKGAIKIRGIQIRTLMERNDLEFYKHSEFCSNRCMSKNTTRSALADIPPTMLSRSPFNIESLYSFHLQNNPYAQLLQPEVQQVIKAEADSDADRITSLLTSATNVPRLDAIGQGRVAAASDGDMSVIRKKPVEFWTAICELDLLPDIISELTVELSKVLNPALTATCMNKAAPKLSQLVSVCGMEERLMCVVNARRKWVETQSAIINSELEELRRRREENVRRQREIKRKSDVFQQLVQEQGEDQSPAKIARIEDEVMH